MDDRDDRFAYGPGDLEVVSEGEGPKLIPQEGEASEEAPLVEEAPAGTATVNGKDIPVPVMTHTDKGK